MSVEGGLFSAIKHGDRQRAVQIISSFEGNINKLTFQNQTILGLALEQQEADIFGLLVQAGADINRQHGARKLSHLHEAIEKRSHGSVALLLENNANPNLQNIRGDTPLHFAAQTGQLTIALRLLEAGADINKRNEQGFTPLHDAVRKGDLEMVQLFVKKGARVNAKDKHGKKPSDYSDCEEFYKVLAPVRDFDSAKSRPSAKERENRQDFEGRH